MGKGAQGRSIAARKTVRARRAHVSDLNNRVGTALYHLRSIGWMFGRAFAHPTM
jgi:hypothetical protein